MPLHKLEDRVSALENQMATYKGMKTVIGGLAAIIILWLAGGAFMLITTDQRATQNEGQIRQMDDRQRDIQTDVTRIGASVERIERYVINERPPR